MTTAPSLAIPVRPADARAILLPYIAALTGAMLLVQLAVVLTDGSGIVAGLLTAAVAVGILLWLRSTRARLARVRFGTAVAHAAAFTVVTASFALHAVVRTIAITAHAGPEAAALAFVGTWWFGATLVMCAAWGIGLLLHLLGAVLDRGWEERG